MNKTKIEWTDYTKNPIKGKCLTRCPYCYAIRMYDRFGWNPEVRFEPKVLDEIRKIRAPSKIFLCSTHEMFGNWILDEWVEEILDTAAKCPQHTFQILTKRPERADWIFPRNCWIGVTVESQRETWRITALKTLANAKLKFVSFEPLQSEIECNLSGIDWIIVGAETGNRKGKIIPEKLWIEKLISQARDRDIPIFLKYNLKWHEKIQEFPIAIHGGLNATHKK